MPFERKIIRHQACPRCNAQAEIRTDGTEEPPLPGVILLSLWCPKCKLKRAAGMTTENVLKLEEQERQLFRLLNENKSQSDFRRIRGKLRRVRQQLQRARLGI